MNRKLTVAAFATTLAVAPVALAQSSWSDRDASGTAISRDAPMQNPGLYVDDTGAAGTYSGAPNAQNWNTESRGRDALDPAAGVGDAGTAISRDAPKQNPGFYVDDTGAAGTYSGAPNAQNWNTESRGRDALDPAAGVGDAGTAISRDAPKQNPGFYVDDTGAAGTYSGAPQAESWDTQSRGPGGDRPMAGATGMPDARTGSAVRPMDGGRVLANFNEIPNFAERKGPGQTRLELMQTTLLNNFSAFGFDGVRDFRKQGANYVADVARGGQWMTVQLDPTTGTIRTMR